MMDDSIKINLRIHSKPVIIRTCYALANEANFWLNADDDVDNITVNIKKLKPEDCLEHLKARFSQSLIDFSLREDIEQKTRSIRDTIVSAALAELRGSSRG